MIPIWSALAFIALLVIVGIGMIWGLRIELTYYKNQYECAVDLIDCYKNDYLREQSFKEKYQKELETLQKEFASYKENVKAVVNQETGATVAYANKLGKPVINWWDDWKLFLETHFVEGKI